MRTLLIVPTGPGAGLTSTCLGLLRSLDFAGLSVSFYKPFSRYQMQGSSEDSSVALVKHTLNLQSPEPIPQSRIERMIGDDRMDDLLEEVVAKQQGLPGDVVIVEGLVPTGNASYADDVNQRLANELDARVILVSEADMDDLTGMVNSLEMHAHAFGGAESDRVLGCILTRVENINTSESETLLAPGEAYQAVYDKALAAMQDHSSLFDKNQFHLLGVVPYAKALSIPRTLDIGQTLNVRWYNKGKANTLRVESSILTARSAANSSLFIKAGTLLVMPGDRDDIVITAALGFMNGVPLAGVLLTGGYQPSDSTLHLCESAFKGGLPVMMTDTSSFDTVSALTKMNPEIPYDDYERAEKITEFVAAHIDIAWLRADFAKDHKARLSPSAYRYQLVQKAQANLKRIVLPEGSEPRTVEAACICQSRGIANCVLLAKRADIEAVAKARDLHLPEGLEIIDPEPIRHRYIDAMVERRKGKLTAPMAEAQLQDSVVVGTMMLYQDEVDGLVSGAIHTTANTVRPAFQFIKTAPDYSLVSSIFFMLLPEQVVVYGDCAINPEPNAEQLAEIAIQSAKSAQAFGIEPRIAMISYSTGESGEGHEVDKVREATRIAKSRAPELMIDGPLQYDAAAIESVGKQKAPNSEVAGRATVFVFPDLNTGNTTYKAVQRSAKVVSVGPMLQGLNKPVNDLSRGALVDDIVFTIALTAIQAASDVV